MRKSVLATLALAFAVAGLCLPLSSQIRETGTIHGYIQDEQNEVLPGATVKISGPNLIGGEKSYISDQKGYYRFPNLPVGSYTVFVELPGFAKVVREISRLSANQSLTVDFVMKPSAVNEVITVTASTPTVDITNSSSGGVVMSEELLLALPAAKELGGLMTMTPGVEGRTAYGIDNESNGYYFDGINVSSPTGGGGWGVSGMLFNPDFNIIQEASVSAIGLNAEFGGFTGAVLQAISKSGSNDFSVLVETWYNGRDWNSQNLGKYSADQFYDPADKDKKFEAGSYLDIGLQVGGKIIKDKLWFFLSGQYDGTKKYPLGYSGVQTGTNWKGFAKLTYQASHRTKMNVSASIDNETTINAGAYAFVDPEADLTWRNPGYLLDVNTTSVLSQNTVFEAKLGYNKKDSIMDPNSGDAPAHYDLATGRMTGNFDSFRKYHDRMAHLSAHLSQYFPELLLGAHDMKIGAELVYAKPTILFGKPGGVNYMDYDGTPMYKFTMDPPSQEQDHSYLEATVFVQDSWSVNKRLTVNLGLRFDAYRYKIPTAELGNVYKNHNIAPRLGVAFDILGDRKNVLKLSYSHYYDKIKDNLFSAADSRTSTTSTYLWTGVDWMFLFSQKADTSYIHIDPDIKQAYVREMSVALERELFRDASLSVTYYHRKAARFMGFVEMSGVWQDLTVTNPGLDGIVGTADDLGPITLHDRLNPDETYYLLTNPRKGQSTAMLDDPKYTAQGLEVVFSKRYSHRWQMVASYHYTKVKGNTDSTFTSIGTGQENFVNSYGEVGYRYGQPHQFKLLANALLPWDIDMGILAEYSSGSVKDASYNDFGTYGSIGYPIVPPGTYHYEPVKQIDLRFQKQFKFMDGKLSLMADVFNLFNESRVLQGETLVGETYGRFYEVQSPRIFRIGFRFQI